jgi:hypothetical protein
MQIFFTDPSPTICAQALDDKRLNKQILECAQVLSTVLHWKMPAEELADQPIYKPTHEQHPISKWCAVSFGNYMWVLMHGLHCVYEREYRDMKGYKHKSASVLYHCHKLVNSAQFGTLGITDFPNCAANDQWMISFKHEKDVHVAYKKYLAWRWKNDKQKPVWTKRNKPDWAELN